MRKKIRVVKNANFPIFELIKKNRAEGKGHEPSRKYFSSSYGSSQLGSDSSLVDMTLKPRFLIKSGYYIVPSPSTALGKIKAIREAINHSTFQ